VWKNQTIILPSGRIVGGGGQHEIFAHKNFSHFKFKEIFRILIIFSVEKKSNFFCQIRENFHHFLPEKGKNCNFSHH
jgi:hypothetical protein